MTKKRAFDIVEAYDKNPSASGDEEIIAIEALTWLVRHYDDPYESVYLAGFYEDLHLYDLAEKYYLLSAEKNNLEALNMLGRLYYYGKLGEPDYEKAYKYFKKSANLGYGFSEYYLALMYRDGCYFEKDYEKYVDYIEYIWDRLQLESDLWLPFPETALRLAEIRLKENNKDEALDLLNTAKDFLTERMLVNNYYENYKTMNEIITTLYKITPLNYDNLDFYDLYAVMTRPCHVSFKYNGKTYEASLESDPPDPKTKKAKTFVRFGDNYYHTVNDFIKNGTLNGKLFMEIAPEIIDIEVTYIDKE